MTPKDTSKTNYLPEVSENAHKYSRGTVAVIAGSESYPGAAVLCVGGARRGGAGYVKYISQFNLPTHLVLHNFPDVVPIPEGQVIDADAWVIGSGAPKISQLPSGKILVLDGSAMTFANTANSGLTIITPHEGEAKNLGFPITDRKEDALRMASALNVIVVLKGPGTIIATPSGSVTVDKTGGKELATAGTGDILSGLMASMLASWRPTTFEEAARIAAKAVEVHGLAGKLASKKAKPVVATDVLEALPKILLN